LPVRYYDWIAHFGDGRRTNRRRSISAALRLTYAQFDAPLRGSPAICATSSRWRARPRRGAGAEHHRYIGSAVRLRPAGAVFLPLTPALRSELHYIVGDGLTQSDDP